MADDQPPPQPAARPSGGRRRAVTIDLEADESAASAASAAADEPASAQGQPSPRSPTRRPRAERPSGGVEGTPPPRRGGSAWQLLAFAFLGALVVFVAGYLLMFTDILPAPGADATDEVQAENEALVAEVADLRSEIDALSAGLDEQAATFDAAIGAIPPPDLTPLETRLAELEAGMGEIAALGERLDATAAAIETVEDGLAAQQDARAQLADTVAELRQDVLTEAAAAGDPEAAARLSADLDVLTQRLAALEADDAEAELAALGDVLDDVRERLGALEEMVSEDRFAALRTDIESLAGDIAALSEETAALAANVGVLEDTRAMARSLAVANLRTAAEGGQPFAAELTALSELGVTEDQLAPLRDPAETGVASSVALADAFPDVGDAILSAEAEANPDAGFFERLWENARGAIIVEPTTPSEGDDPPAVVSRMRAAVAAGDLVAALAERALLSEAGLAASAEWAAAAERRVALDTALADLAASVLGG